MIRFRAEDKRETSSKEEQGHKGNGEVEKALREIAALKVRLPRYRNEQTSGPVQC